MAGLPVHPRLAALLLGSPPDLAGEAADLCALLSERDPWLRRPGEPVSADLGLRLLALQAFREHRGPGGMDGRHLAAIDRAAAQLRHLVRGMPGQEQRAVATSGGLLALAYPDRIAQRRPEQERRYLLAQGSGVALPPDDPLLSHPYLVVSSLDATGRDGRIQLALPISEQEIQALFGERIQCERVLTWDPNREAASAQEVRRLDAITLSTRPVPLLTSDSVTDLLLTRILRNPGEALNWSDATRQFQARVNLMRALEPDTCWPDLTPDQLAHSLETWLGPWLRGKTRLDEVRALDLAAILATRLDRELRQRLEQEAPASLVTPAGARRTIDYLAGDIPVLPVPLQEMLGTRETPTIARGRVPLLVQLLSPAHRPIQLTRDLPGFWTGSYLQVRKEMRGRYPKHHWPEDPLNAVPMARSIKSKGA